jgi:hypothetical protein
LAAIALGLASAAFAVRRVDNLGQTRVGPWVTSSTVGSADASFYERAVVAVHALFVLNRSQTIYFRALTDDGGARLRAECDYELRGRPLPARWWSMTVYGDDDFLIANAEDRYSFNMRNIAIDAGGGFVVRIGERRQPGNWLPTAGRQPIKLTLRLYNPEPDAADRPGAMALPSVRLLGCP